MKLKMLSKRIGKILKLLLKMILQKYKPVIDNILKEFKRNHSRIFLCYKLQK